MRLYVGLWLGTLLALAVVWYFQGMVATLYGAGMFACGFSTHKHRSYLKELAKVPHGYLSQKWTTWWGA